MDELNRKRALKLLNSKNPDFEFIQNMVDQSVEFVVDHTEIIEVDAVSLDDIFNLRPEEVLSINQCYIQKIIAFNTNFIAIGKWMEDDAKLYTVMYASRNPSAFVFDVKNDFGIDIYK